MRPGPVLCVIAACGFEPGELPAPDALLDALIDVPSLPASCRETSASGITTIEVAGEMERVFCEQTVDGGGWTLIGAFVNNDGSRAWDSLESLSDGTTFGSVDARETADYKARAFSTLAGTSILVATEEYSFSFHDLFISAPFATFVTRTWPTTCATSWQREGTSFSQGLSPQQASALGVIVRPLDSNNAACFPAGQAAAIGFLVGSLHNNGLANSPEQPVGAEPWATVDMSLPKLSSFNVFSCTGPYPCNNSGVVKSWDDYGPAVKAQRTMLFIR